MEYLLLLLAFPLIWPFIAKKIWSDEISWAEVGINFAGVALLVSGVWFAGSYGSITDTEIWNGSVVAKQREHDKYVRSYQCNCRSYSCGTSKSPRTCTTCSTCYEDHYTATWTATLNFGGAPYRLVLDHYDTTSRRRRNNKPDPSIYLNCAVGQPASIEQTYTNYVQAVPDSLFNNQMDDQVYADKIPEYPRVYGKYKINRVLTVDSNVPSHLLTALNERLNENLKTLGPQKQANIIVIVTGIKDAGYRYAVENAWVGGKKNDIVVFLGMDETQMLWAGVMTFALNKGNELFQVTLRDRLNNFAKTNEFEPNEVADIISKTAFELFDRISMEEFQYLEDQIQPPTWVIILAVFLSIGGSIGLSFVMRRVEIGHSRRYNRF